MDVPNQIEPAAPFILIKYLSRDGTAPLAPFGFPILHIKNRPRLCRSSPILSICDSGYPSPQGFTPTVQSSKSAILLICLGRLLAGDRKSEP